jgi:hypothetical protein
VNLLIKIYPSFVKLSIPRLSFYLSYIIKTSILKKPLAILIFLLLNLFNSDAQDSCNLKVSLITCGPGEELYTTFGHTAIRVQSKETGEDIAFNYGTFEFGPDFYSKFTKGTLLYYLSLQDFKQFLSDYKEDKRYVKEQVLDISCSQKEQLLNALLKNAEPQYRYYKYHFLFDNCTTRAKNMIAANMGSLQFTSILPQHIPTFRNLIHGYLDTGKEYWSKFGIDLLLGSNVDRKVTNEEAMFLPENLMKGMDKASVDGHKIALPEQTLLASVSAKQSFQLTPLLVFWFLFILVVALSFNSSTTNRKVLTVFDFLFFFITGIAGALMLVLWIIRDDEVCRMNFNMIWAMPFNLIMAFVIHKKSQWVKTYFRYLFFIEILFLITSPFLPQQFNYTILPIVLLIIYRSWLLSKPNQYGRKNSLT